MEKFTLNALPITTEFLRQKRVIQDRGEIALIEDGLVFRHLTYFSLIPGEANFRGGHYHKRKTEHFYIIGGKLRILLNDMESGEKSAINVVRGDRLTILPMCAHRFTAIEHAQVIEYFEDVYDPEDDYRL